MSVVDHKRSQPLLEQVRILPPREVQLGIQGGRFDPVVAVADSLNGDLAEDRQVGTLAGSVQAGKFVVLVRGRITSYGQGRTDVPRTGQVQERMEQPSPDNQEFSKDDLLDLVYGLMLIGGVLKMFDQAPERLESFTEVHRASLLLGRRREIELDGGSSAGKHEFGSSSCGVCRDQRHPGTYRIERAVSKPSLPRPKS